MAYVDQIELPNGNVYDLGSGLNKIALNVVNENIPISLQDKEVTENGTVTADQGYDGLGEVTVNVSGGSGSSNPNPLTELNAIRSLLMANPAGLYEIGSSEGVSELYASAIDTSDNYIDPSDTNPFVITWDEEEPEQLYISCNTNVEHILINLNNGDIGEINLGSGFNSLKTLIISFGEYHVKPNLNLSGCNGLQNLEFLELELYYFKTTGSDTDTFTVFVNGSDFGSKLKYISPYAYYSGDNYGDFEHNTVMKEFSSTKIYNTDIAEGIQNIPVLEKYIYSGTSEKDLFTNNTNLKIIMGCFTDVNLASMASKPALEKLVITYGDDENCPTVEVNTALDNSGITIYVKEAVYDDFFTNNPSLVGQGITLLKIDDHIEDIMRLY